MRPVRYKKGIAIELRQKGQSYSEIESALHLPKSTLSFWLKNVKLTPEQSEKLSERRMRGLIAGRTRKSSRTPEAIERLQKVSAQDIQKISKRELWLMGIILYWRERFSHDLQKGVRFTSSDPKLINFFLKWLKDVGQISDEEILFDIFAPAQKRNNTLELVSHWSEATGFPRDSFSRFYFYKERRKKIKRESLKKSTAGLLRIRVRASSMLARQISGWVKGITEYFAT
ncbi:MAG: hypothetical protein KW806_02260 [Candidatus Yanofskybacteria bacterium]|nr:hypothetical protein [Candidatus Yanofskybacteria bacterium]